MDEQTVEALRYLASLREHALRRLPYMVDREEHLFSYRSRALEEGWVNEGVSIRYSAIALIGLLKEGNRAHKAIHDLERIAQRLLALPPKITGPGDIALILWAAVEALEQNLVSRTAAEEAARQLLTTLRKERAKTARTVDTMEYSWVLVALVRALGAGLGEPITASLIEETCMDLLLNFEKDSSLFFFERVERRGKPPKRKRLSFFAEQVYGVMALAEYFGVTGDERALDAALSCADKIVSCQTKRGGWPWRYDVRRAVVAETFPLYSVHQDAMAPLALARLSLVSGRDYLGAISRGILWLAGKNEMGIRLHNERLDVIWRALRRKGPVRILSEVNKALSLAGIDSVRLVDRVLPLYEVVPETRSYHLGWILCAWSALEDLFQSAEKPRSDRSPEDARR